MKESSNNVEQLSYTGILKYQINASGYKYPLDAYCPPLYWYIKMFCKHSSGKRMQDIAYDLHIDKGLLTKKLNVKNRQHRELTVEDIEALCSIMQASLLSIIQTYEQRDFYEKNPDYFDKLTKINASDIKDMFEKHKVLTTPKESDVSKTTKKSVKSIPKSTVSSPNIESLAKKWYFYFPSSDSSIIEHRKKIILKGHSDKEFEDSSIQELYDLYSDDHIYSGTLEISSCNINRTTTYKAKLEYLTNPVDNVISCYEGEARASINDHAVFVTLNNVKNSEMIYIIIDTLNIDPDFQFAMASVLTLSKNKSTAHRRPCSLRMILSQSIIPFGTKLYNIMCSNLMMNDSIIRIDEHGYNELKKYKDEYSSPALNLFLEKYPDINTMETSSNFITVHKCAYITESLIYNLKDINPNETLYLEALLRLHSTTPWYSKAKAVKANTLLSAFDSDTM